MAYFAHTAENGRVQTVEDHLTAVSALSSAFTAAFCAGEQGKLIGLAHDVGKCSEDFQERLRGGKIVDHASAGAWECAKLDALWAACCVAGHHGGLPDVGNMRNDTPSDATVFGRLKKAMAQQIPHYTLPIPLPQTPPPAGYGADYLSDSFIIRMLYSCLVDADYLDTEQFVSGGMVQSGHYDTIPMLLEKLNRYIAPWQKPTNDLNRRRCEILNACVHGGGDDRGLYTLTVPTGGGKTVASMAFALHHATKHGMERVIYVIPYTSIIEQNAAVFRSIFGAENIVEHHCNASYEIGDSDDNAQYQQIRATENWDAPIIVTTAVQFFESLYSNRPSKCRKLHNIANSVVIFDEAQMIPTAHLRPCVAAIAKLVKDFRVTAVLCTATQPVLDDLIARYAPDIRARELCPDREAVFARFRRVTFRQAGAWDMDTLCSRLSLLPQVLCIVNSRKAAQEVFARLPEDGSYHLSTLMYPAHRRAVLTEIRSRLEAGLPCRVVSTSLIEAGVDVDFPAVFREMAGLDSILQAAGRCNREGKRPVEESVVTVFSGVSATPSLAKVNIGAAKTALAENADPAAPETVTRYFSAYRTLMKQSSLDKSEVISAFEHGIQGCILPFRTVAERFHLIDSATKTVYVPLGDGATLVERLRAGERSRALFRALGQYSVSIYEAHYQSLLSAGGLIPVDDDSAILCDLHRYVLKTGLMMCENESTNLSAGFFI